MANCNDLTDKMEKLVVEEKSNEKNWNNLPDEMKEMVVKEMPYDTRTRLKMCSKSDKYLVESMKMNYDVLRISAEKREENTLFNIILQMNNNPKLDFSLSMASHTDDSEVAIVRNLGKVDEHIKQIACSSGKDGEMMMKRFFERVVFDRNLCFNCLNISGTYPGLLDGREFTLHPKLVKIKGMTGEVTGWLRNMAPGVEDLKLEKDDGDFDETIDGLGTIPAVMNADMLVIEIPCDIDDDQFANFKCTVASFRGKSNVTGKGINQFIKKVIANDYRACLEIVLNEVEVQTWNDIIEGLDVKVRLSHDEPEDEQGQVKFGYREGCIQMNQGKRMKILVANEDKSVIMIPS